MGYPQAMINDEGQQRRDYLMIEAVDPADGTRCIVLISHQRIQAIGRRSMGQAKECAYTVPAILQKPTAIFEGLRSDEDEDRRGYGWRCYCGRPDCAFDADGSERPPYPGQVFLVFVNDERVAYNWRWEKADSDSQQLPAGYQERFKRQLL